MLSEGAVGVDGYSRFRVVDNEKQTIEQYPWPFKAPHFAVLYALNVMM